MSKKKYPAAEEALSIINALKDTLSVAGNVNVFPSGKFDLEDIGLSIHYGVAGCSTCAGCQGKCSGACSGCTGCSGCSDTSSSHSTRLDQISLPVDSINDLAIKVAAALKV